MKYQRHFETASPEQQVQIKALIDSFRRNIERLGADIETEEELTRVHHIDEADYPILARSLRARRDNLTATVDLLQRRLQSQ